jgi:putative effector of murein hydrolase LrgA (UPF0299 family)
MDMAALRTQILSVRTAHPTGLAISVALVLSAVLTIAVTGLTMTFLMRRVAHREGEG